jgi:hypothetical protein
VQPVTFMPTHQPKYVSTQKSPAIKRGSEAQGEGHSGFVKNFVIHLQTQLQMLKNGKRKKNDLTLKTNKSKSLSKGKKHLGKAKKHFLKALSYYVPKKVKRLIQGTVINLFIELIKLLSDYLS